MRQAEPDLPLQDRFLSNIIKRCATVASQLASASLDVEIGLQTD